MKIKWSTSMILIQLIQILKSTKFLEILILNLRQTYRKYCKSKFSLQKIGWTLKIDSEGIQL